MEQERKIIFTTKEQNDAYMNKVDTKGYDPKKVSYEQYLLDATMGFANIILDSGVSVDSACKALKDCVKDLRTANDNKGEK